VVAVSLSEKVKQLTASLEEREQAVEAARGDLRAWMERAERGEAAAAAAGEALAGVREREGSGCAAVWERTVLVEEECLGLERALGGVWAGAEQVCRRYNVWFRLRALLLIARLAALMPFFAAGFDMDWCCCTWCWQIMKQLADERQRLSGVDGAFTVVWLAACCMRSHALGM
jgi:hypothetical protein